MQSGQWLLTIIVIAMPFMGTSASAGCTQRCGDRGIYIRPFDRVFGEEAKALFELAADPGDADQSKPVEMAVGCHFVHASSQSLLSLAFCESPAGFISDPVRKILSDILIIHRSPILIDSDDYAIGARFSCVAAPQFECRFEDYSTQSGK